jgi:hypothetical protein
VAGGLIAETWRACSSTKGRCPIRRRTDRNDQEKTSLRGARLRWPDYPEIERIHREVLDFKHIEAISEPTTSHRRIPLRRRRCTQRVTTTPEALSSIGLSRASLASQ